MKSQVARGALVLREPTCEGQVQIHTQPIMTVLGWTSDSNPSPLLSISQHAVQVLGPGAKLELVENERGPGRRTKKAKGGLRGRLVDVRLFFLAKKEVRHDPPTIIRNMKD